MAKKSISKGRAIGNANLKSWKPGQSGNLNGAPRQPAEFKTFRAFAKKLCADKQFQARIGVLANEGNTKALESILHYGEGKPKDTVEVSMKMDTLTEAELREKLAKLRAKK